MAETYEDAEIILTGKGAGNRIMFKTVEPLLITKIPGFAQILKA